MINNDPKILYKTPKDLYDILCDKVIGQDDAKIAVAIAYFNRQRRLLLKDDKMQNSIYPKNILLYGPTGVGKTEIGRNLADITSSPFTKVDMTKFTEVGYAGKDVDSIIKDFIASVYKKQKITLKADFIEKELNTIHQQIGELYLESLSEDKKMPLADILDSLKKGNLDNKYVEISHHLLKDGKFLNNNIGLIDFGDFIAHIGLVKSDQDLTNSDEEHNGKETKKHKAKKMKIKDAIEYIVNIEFNKHFSDEEILKISKYEIENKGIIFLDEIDKIISHKDNANRGEVSREGVQRDLLAMLEGSVINTDYGPINTSHILFIGAGAFSSVSYDDLMPEIQGRLPIKVELKSLSQNELILILTKVKYNLLQQYQALLGVDEINISFSEDGINAIAEYTYNMNTMSSNIGARRLSAIVEKIVQDLSFNGIKNDERQIIIDKKYVDNKLSDIYKDKFDLNKFTI